MEIGEHPKVSTRPPPARAIANFSGFQEAWKRVWIRPQTMSSEKDAQHPDNRPSAGDGTDEQLVAMTPDAVELKPIIPPAKKPATPAEVPPVADPGTPEGAPVKKKKTKVHAPDPRGRISQPTLVLADEKDLGDLPEMPALRPEPISPEDLASVVVEELSPFLEEQEGPPPAEAAGEESPATEVIEPPDTPPASPNEPGNPQSETAPAGTSGAAPVAAGPDTSRPKWSLDTGDRKWLIILLAGLLVIGGVFYFMLRSGLPVDSIYHAQSKPNLPIKGQKVTIGNLEMDWKDEGSGSLAGGIKANTLLPRLSLRFEAGSRGAVRIFFKNERDQLVGDTVDFELAGEAVERVVTCTGGLRSRLEYDALRARDLARWTIEIHEGPNPQAPLAEFQMLCRLAIPWNLDRESSP
jgi:hypothetical protein